MDTQNDGLEKVAPALNMAMFGIYMLNSWGGKWTVPKKASWSLWVSWDGGFYHPAEYEDSKKPLLGGSSPLLLVYLSNFQEDSKSKTILKSDPAFEKLHRPGLKTELSGGFMFLMFVAICGNDPIWCAYFFRWVGEKPPPN